MRIEILFEMASWPFFFDAGDDYQSDNTNVGTIILINGDSSLSVRSLI